MKNKNWAQRGVSAIEFAIVLPVLLAILLGIVNYGLLMYNQAVITNAAREGARWASIHNTAATGDEACDVARNYAEDHLISFAAPALVVTQSNGGTFLSGEAQEVTVTYTYTGVGALLEYLFVRNGEYKATAVMLHE